LKSEGHSNKFEMLTITLCASRCDSDGDWVCGLYKLMPSFFLVYHLHAPTTSFSLTEIQWVKLCYRASQAAGPFLPIHPPSFSLKNVRSAKTWRYPVIPKSQSSSCCNRHILCIWGSFNVHTVSFTCPSIARGPVSLLPDNTHNAFTIISVQNVVLPGVDFPCSRAPVPCIGNSIPVNRKSGRTSSPGCTVSVTSRYKVLPSFAGDTHGVRLSITVSLLHQPSYKFYMCLGLAALLPEHYPRAVAFHVLHLLCEITSSLCCVMLWDVGSSIGTVHSGTVTFGTETV
jgi:hypothetical protein